MLFQNEAKLYGMYRNETPRNPAALHELDAVVFCPDISSEKFAFSLQIRRARLARNRRTRDKTRPGLMRKRAKA